MHNFSNYIQQIKDDIKEFRLKGFIQKAIKQGEFSVLKAAKYFEM